MGNDLSHCQEISLIFQSASAGGVSPAGQWPRAGAGICLAALCTAGVSLLLTCHQRAESAFCTSTPRAATQRENSLWTFKKTPFPTPNIFYFLFSCKWFYCLCSFRGMTIKWRSDNNWCNSWWQFWIPVSAVEYWLCYFIYWMGELPHFPIMPSSGCQTPSSCHANETEHDQDVMADVSLQQESVGADSLTHY